MPVIEQMEYQLLDRMSYQHFCLLQDTLNIPDRNTIWRFAQRIGVNGAAALLQDVDAQLQRHGYMARGGHAALVPAPHQHIGKDDKERLAQGKDPDWSEAQRRQKDLDATDTKKHGKSYFGYKLSVSVDIKHGFIRCIATGTASEHDGNHFEEVLDEHNTVRDVYADKAYPSKRRQEMLQVLGWRDGMQRRTSKDKPLSECQKRRNRKIASKRAKVEHVFAGIRHLGGKFIRTIGQARADVAMTLMAACYNNKRLAMFLSTGVDPFYKQARA